MWKANLDEGFGCLEEMLAALWLRAFLMPVDDGLFRYTILLIQHLRPDVDTLLVVLKYRSLP